MSEFIEVNEEDEYEAAEIPDDALLMGDGGDVCEGGTRDTEKGIT